MRRIIILTVVIMAGIMSCSTPQKIDSVAKDEKVSSPIKHPQVEALLKQMTLSEKIGQMNQYNGFWNVTGPAPDGGDAAQKYENLRSGLVGSMLNIKGVDEVRKIQKIAVEESRLGIPIIFGYDIIHGYKTVSPIPLAEAASWDLEAIRKSCEYAAREAASAGINWTFAPNVDISRDARWGRVMEGAGEDPYLGSLVAAARVKGFQGDDLSDPFTMAACAKHFAGYGFAEAGRDYNTVDISGATLHNVVMPPFKAAVDAGAATFMNAFNELNGIPATSNVYLQRDILKGDWGFDGVVVSDWGSIGEIVIHGQATDAKDATVRAVKAGCDMDMESYFYVKHLKGLVESGEVSMDLVDDAARRILNLKKELGLLDDPYKYCNNDRESATVYAEENRAVVLDMAKKSIVLLKNDGLLPLKQNQKVAVIGPLVDEDNSPLGSWRIPADDHTAVTVKAGLMKHENYDWSFHQGVKLLDKDAAFVFETRINTTDPSGIEEAATAAKDADVVIMVLGEHGFQSGEGRSRTRLDFPGLQQELLEAVHANNKNIILVSMSGRPLDLTWADANIPTIVQAWHLGTETGNAIASVLTGEYNPSGKLPMSFPRNVGQEPLYYNTKNTGRPSILPNKDLVFWSHYIDEENTPLYPFGYGESYTSFDYNNLKVEQLTNNQFKVTVQVTNSGKIAGEEVAQLYIRDVAAQVTRPIRELKGFDKQMYKAGESKTIEFMLTDRELGYFDNNGLYHVEDGTFEIMVGGDSNEVLRTSMERKPMMP